MKKEVTIEDLHELLMESMQITSDGFMQLNERMDRLEGRMDNLEGRMDALEKASREHTKAIQELTVRVDRIEQQLEGIDGDIRYLYSLIEKLKKDMKSGKLSEQDTRSRLEEVEAIAKRLSIKYGV